MEKVTLGRSGLQVSALGVGCMEIGGPMVDLEQLHAQAGGSGRFWLGAVEDDTSISSLRTALDAGVNFFDTAPAYGAGHSERVLAAAFAGRRGEVVIATKFGKLVDESARAFGRYEDGATLVANIRPECEASLKRLGTDYIDLYQYHQLGFDLLERADQVIEILERLVEEGKVRWYGWSTDNPESVRTFSDAPHFISVQLGLNMVQDQRALVMLCRERGLGVIARGAFAMGFLTGKYNSTNIGTLLAPDDFRMREKDTFLAMTRHLDGLNALAQREGRTLAHLALGWIWGKYPGTIAIPGFRTSQQMGDNLAAFAKGPLSKSLVSEIDAILEKPVVDDGA